MLADLQARAAEAVELALAAGAGDAWASASRDRSVDFTVRDGKLEKVQEATSRSLSVRLWVDGRYSSHSTTDLRPDRLAAFLADAVALTRALQPDPHRRIPDPALFAGRPTAVLDLVDPALAAVTRDQRLGWCQDANARVAGQEGVISATSWAGDSHGMGAAASSNGFHGAWESTSLSLGTEVTMRDQGDERPEESMYAGGRHLADLRPPTDLADEALRRARARLGATRGPTTRAVMVVEPRAAGRLLGALLAAANGASVQQSRSMWADKVGKKLLSEKLVLTDDPLLPRGFGSRHFDGEGISARPLPVIADGALQMLYLDTYYASKLGMAPTTGGSSNRVVRPGSRDLAAIVGAADDGVLVTSWLGGNSDATTGDFSFGLRGHRIHKGQVGAPVSEMNVTGNLLELFAHLAEVGSDPWLSSSTLVPTLVFEGVQFSGA